MKSLPCCFHEGPINHNVYVEKAQPAYVEGQGPAAEKLTTGIFRGSLHSISQAVTSLQETVAMQLRVILEFSSAKDLSPEIYMGKRLIPEGLALKLQDKSVQQVVIFLHPKYNVIP